MKKSQILALVVLVFLAAWVGTRFGAVALTESGASAGKETAYQRVMRTKTLRCGYIPYSYAFRIDPTTHQMSGVLYDVLEEIGRLNHIKIEWAEELTWATFVTALETGRVDAFCSGIWIETQNAKFVAYSSPLYYNGIGIYGRADENRFAAVSDLNQPSVRLMARDGGTPQIIARQEFPKATEVAVASSVSDGELIEGVLAKKADILIYGDDYLSDYMKNNPGKLKELFAGTKIRVYPLAIGLPMLDVGLKNMIDSTLLELRGSKFIEKALEKNAPGGAWISDLSAIKS